MSEVAIIRHGRRRLTSVVVTATLAVVAQVALGGGPAFAAAPPPGVSPVVQRTSGNVTADALPTVQIDGVVWAQATVGNTVYAGGDFHNARPAGAAAGTNLTTRNNLLAFDITTGQLNTSFAPSLNAKVEAIAKSPDGSRVYVGGSFTQANGVNRARIAAYSTATGALITTFAPSLDATVNAISVTNDAVYVGGIFGVANGVSRPHLAAFSTSGALLGWAPAADANVQGVVVTPDGSRVIVGGSFQHINGASVIGLAAIDATTGVMYPWAANQVVRDGGPHASILSLTTDGTYIYSTAYVYGQDGNFEGALSADPNTGNINWLADCHGDTYDTFGANGVVYVVSHQHYCSNIGGFPDTNPRSVWHRATAFTQRATGTVLTNGQTGGGYGNFAGQPSPSLINWLPDLDIGSFTGQGQAAWSLTGNSQYLSVGGEFPKVNGTGQQGLARFAVPTIAPNVQGPRQSAGAIPTTLSVRSPSSVRVSWPTNWDRDDRNLTYTVTRNGTTVFVGTAVSQFWNPRTLAFTNTGLSPGTTYTYRVKVTDPNNNAAFGNNTSVTTSSGTATSEGAFARDVLGDGASNYWRLNQSTGSSNADFAGSTTLTVNGGVQGGAAGAVNDPDKASTFNGSSTGFATTTAAVGAPNDFSVGAWFKTTSTSGGKIVGFGSSSSGTSGTADRHIYMDASGRINFGVLNSARYVVTSPNSFRDGQYHFAVGTLSSSGLTLYVDGQVVGTNAGTAVGRTYSGFWRVGGDSSWSGANFFNGSIDDVAVYPLVLTAAQVRQQYVDTGRSTTGATPPTASFTASVSGATVSTNGTGSTATGATITSYAWDFGDGGTGTGVTASHKYTASGTYSVTLTVTDSNGLTDSVSKSVTATVPPTNQPPSASFTATPSNLAVAFNASASADPDGTITGYAWNFGDGATGTGVAPNHTYATAGSRTVTLTVTDNSGATGTATKVVSVGTPAVLASDSFSRTVSNGWGSADAGGPWAVVGSASPYSVGGTTGRVDLAAAGTSTLAVLNSVSAANVTMTVDVSIDKAPTGNGVYSVLVARRTSAGDYRLRLRLLPAGETHLAWTRVVSGQETVVAERVIAGLTYSPGQILRVRWQVNGDGTTTTLAGKVWAASSAEPATAQITGTDTQPTLQGAGAVGVQSILGSTSTSAPVAVTYDNFVVTPS